MRIDGSFGTWLKARRKALDLTQAELAQQVGCAAVTIRKLEADALRPSRPLAESLAHTLMIPPGEHPQIVQAARAGRAPSDDGPRPQGEAASAAPEDPAEAVAPRAPHLPRPASPVLGREAEIADLHMLLADADVRLVTLTGPGGIGKTRLALAVATLSHATFPGGVTFVDLTTLRDPRHVLPAIATAVGVQVPGGHGVERRLQAALRDRRCLLVLDNFEQVLAAGLAVGALLDATAAVSILVTSRARLHLQREHEVAVLPLAPSAAATLFTTRAVAARPTFAATADAATISAICERLDGLPLAIELAAARVRLFSPRDLLERLTHQLAVLSGGPRDAPARHQTLRTTIDWSYQLLTASDQRLFRHLGVFVGGWTLATAEAMCGGPGIDAGLTHLLDQSLLVTAVDSAGELRFRMLESVREYAAERVAESGGAENLKQRHATTFDVLVQQLAPTPQTGDIGTWNIWLGTEYGNLRAALQWALEHADVPTATHIGLALQGFWWTHGVHREAGAFSETLLALTSQPPADPDAHGAWMLLRIRLLNNAWNIAVARGDFVAAGHFATAHLALAATLNDVAEIAVAQGEAGHAALWQGDNPEAEALLTASLALERTLEPRGTRAWLLILLGEAAWSTGAYDRARVLLDEALAVAQQVADPIKTAWALRHLGTVACLRGDGAQADDLLRNSLRRYQAVEDVWGVEECLEIFTWVWGHTGLQAPAPAGWTWLVRAARLLGATSVLREVTGHPSVAACQRIHERNAAAIRAAMGEGAFTTAYAEGSALTYDQAVADALAPATAVEPALRSSV